MVFEDKKYYVHSGGLLLHTLCFVNSYLYGQGKLIGEYISVTKHSGVIDVDHLIDHEGYKEISEEEWKELAGKRLHR